MGRPARGVAALHLGSDAMRPTAMTMLPRSSDFRSRGQVSLGWRHDPDHSLRGPVHLARLGSTRSGGATSINERLAGTYGNIPLSRCWQSGSPEGKHSRSFAHRNRGTGGGRCASTRSHACWRAGQNRLIALAYARLGRTIWTHGLSDAQLLAAQILDAGQQFDEVAIEWPMAPFRTEAPEALNALW